MDIKTAKKVCRALPAKHSILIRGGHGIGKSEMVRQLVSELSEQTGIEYTYIDRRMSQMTEGDVIGLPKVEDEVTRFLPAEFVKTACLKPTILFLDEINRATQEVMQACFQLCLDRELNGNTLHPETRIFSAINASALYQVNEMDPAFLDRFFVIDLTPSAQDFFEWCEDTSPNGGNLDKDLLRFLKERESRLDPSEANPGTVQPSRRSWARLDGAYKASKVFEADFSQEGDAMRGFAYNLAVGYVGNEAASDLTDFLAKRESRFTAAQVYGDYPKHRAKIKKLGQDKLNTLIDLLVEHAKATQLTVEDAENLGLFVGDLPGELRVSFITNYTKGTRQTKLFTENFRTINGPVMKHIVAVFNDKEKAEAAADPAPAEDKKPKGKAKK